MASAVQESNPILASAEALQPQLVEMRRAFHNNPEPGFGEFQTSLTVTRYLAELGLTVRTADEAMDPKAVFYRHTGRIDRAYTRAREAGVDDETLARLRHGGTAVVADLETGRPGPTVAFRVDMDCLPVHEAEEADHTPTREGFRSAVDGEMHACGHDGHMTIGLGAASLLAAMRDQLRGKVRFIFQPAEEGVLGGAAAIAAKGLVDDVDYIVALHIGLGARQNEIVPRAYFLATSKYKVELRGAPAHVTNNPQGGRNALLAACSAALSLHSIAPHSGGWYSLYVGVMHAGDEQGVTPPWATMEMGFSAENMDVHDYVDRRLHEVIAGTAAAWGVTSEVTCIGRAPTALDQDPFLAGIARAVAERIPGLHVTDEVACRAGEDACLLLERVRGHGGKGIYALVGSDLADGHHSARFDFDERALVTGTALLAGIAVDILENED